MKGKKQRRACFWGVALVSLLSTYTALCPYICSTSQETASVKITHSCHSEASQENQKNNQSATCCDRHDQAVLEKNSTSHNAASLELSLAVFQIEISSYTNLSPFYYNLAKDPPISFSKEPLYISKESLII